MPTFIFGGDTVISVFLDEIEAMARRVVESEGMELVDLEYKSGQSRNLLRIFIDKTGGVNLDDCEKVSRQLSAILDVKDILKNAYVLEVSSPGLERPLRTDRDFLRTLGRTLKVRFRSEPDGNTEVIGKLLEIREQNIVLEVAGDPREIPLDQVKFAVQEVTMGQQHRLRRRKRK